MIRRTVIVLLAIFAVVCMVWIGVGLTQASDSSPRAGPVSSTDSVPQATQVPPPSSNESEGPVVAGPQAAPVLEHLDASDPRVAVASAAVTVDMLGSAQFWPREQITAIVRQLLVPNPVLQEDLITSIAESGEMLAKIFGYRDAAQASQAVSYYVETQSYKVDYFDHAAGKATIRLYSVTHWVTANKLEYRAPAINIVEMELVGENWLYASSSDPPPDQVPEPYHNLSYEEAVQRFQPYLEGFESYVIGST